ncbi:MAG: hypothetical protein WBA51_08235 [Erythrobacter sp.]
MRRNHAIFFGVIAFAGFLSGMHRLGLSAFMPALTFLLLLIGGLAQGRTINVERVENPRRYWTYLSGYGVLIVLSIAVGFLTYGKSAA